MINQLTILRKSGIIGISSIFLASVSLSAQALSPNLVHNGGFTPDADISTNKSAYLGNGAVTISDWTFPSGALDFVVADGTTYATNINAANIKVGKVQLDATTPVAATVNSPNGSGWYIASDGSESTTLYPTPVISQTINDLTVGQNYTLTFYQASAQQAGGSIRKLLMVTLKLPLVHRLRHRLK